MENQRTQVRIVAGTLRGRKIDCVVSEGLRPTPQMVREAMFSILGNAVPDRLFLDVFAGTGVNGFEAISRGASRAIFIERDARLLHDLEKYADKFAVRNHCQFVKMDAYRWAERWIPPANQPVNVFLSPPFIDLVEKTDLFLELSRVLLEKVPDESVIIIQAEDGFPHASLPEPELWDIRTYGRNMLLFWVKGLVEQDEENQNSQADSNQD